MIPRDRRGTEPPKPLVHAKGPGEKERVRVRAWIDKKRSGKRPTFAAYKADGIADALERLFERKCAYCETVYVLTQPVDVEHWRPKADVEVGPKQMLGRGYEWLAAEWSNLLPSCIDCNRGREQLVLEEGDVTHSKKLVSGKANQFPVADELRRMVHWTDDPAGEGALLLDPCEPGFDGAGYFAFDDRGAIVPRDPASSTNQTALRRRLRAVESIRVYALNRSELVAARRERLVLIDARCTVVRKLIKVAQTLKAEAKARPSTKLSAAAEELTTLASDEISRLRELMLPHQPYALMARLRMATFLKEIADG